MVGELCSLRVTALLQFCEHARDLSYQLAFAARPPGTLSGTKAPFSSYRITLREEGRPGCPRIHWN
jgi:hypothetical protein